MSKPVLFPTRNGPKPLKVSDHTPKVSWLTNSFQQHQDSFSTTSHTKPLAYSMETINERSKSKQTHNSSNDRNSKLKVEFLPYNPYKSVRHQSSVISPTESTSSIEHDTDIPDEREY